MDPKIRILLNDLLVNLHVLCNHLSVAASCTPLEPDEDVLMLLDQANQYFMNGIGIIYGIQEQLNRHKN